MNHIDFSALTLAQKYAMSTTLELSADEHPEVWNSLIRSDILTARDLYESSLGRPFPIQRLYSSKTNGLKTFFEYLKIATQQYSRKLLLIQVIVHKSHFIERLIKIKVRGAVCCWHFYARPNRVGRGSRSQRKCRCLFLYAANVRYSGNSPAMHFGLQIEFQRRQSTVV